MKGCRLCLHEETNEIVCFSCQTETLGQHEDHTQASGW